MGRPRRVSDGGLVYHVLNRANARATLFMEERDYRAFEGVLAQALALTGTRLIAYCLMPNHWHLIVWPRSDGELSIFAGWMSATHARRWHDYRGSTGSGHVYQGRFKSFPLRNDDHFYKATRYVERNALRANLVARAEEWRWSSLYQWLHGRPDTELQFDDWPLPRPDNWLDWVNTPLSEDELAALRTCVARGRPYGPDTWCRRVAKKLGLESTLRSRGRPRKDITGE